MNPIAESYVKLSLALGVHDGDFVDAYHGPAEWQAAATAEKLPLAAIQERARALRAGLAACELNGLEEMGRLRHEYLTKQLRAMEARIEMLGGKRYAFDEESRLLFDAVAPVNSEEYFRAMLTELDRALPGPGSLTERLDAFKKQFIIPPEKLDAVFQAAIKACRERTLSHLALPAGESFTVEYVTKKPWGGYNWYKGNYHSLIQVNTDLPVYIDRAVDLAAHEGYPGHHVYNALLEKNLLRDRGWIEFSVYPLFSPQSLIAEGTANYGKVVVFTAAERLAFERDVLFPLAGLEATRVGDYYRILDLTKRLSFAGNEAARRYLNGDITAAEAVDWLNRFALMTPARAQQSVRFMDKYRSYVINYNLGEEIVRHYIERKAGADPVARWRVFGELISSPRLPSGLK
ncbi:MAG: hypothetical protein PSV13_03465 [Lacunisphaera sp.]|nr:hypothetical protein [Lacunisphaera sp.]